LTSMKPFTAPLLSCSVVGTAILNVLLAKQSPAKARTIDVENNFKLNLRCTNGINA
jgi:hypothetical protein